MLVPRGLPASICSALEAVFSPTSSGNALAGEYDGEAPIKR